MAGQDIMQLTFDIPLIKRDAAQMKQAMDEVFASADRLDGKKIQLGQIEGLADFKKLQADIQKGFTDLNASTANYNKTLSEYIANTQASTKATNDQEKATRAKVKTDKENLTSEEKAAKAELETIKQKKESTKYQDALNKVNNADAKIQAQLTDERTLLRKALIDQEKAYANLYLTQGKNNEQTVAAREQVLQTRAILDDVNQSIGRYNDNVGNYAQKFNGYANVLRGLRGPTKLLGEALGVGAQEADQFRIVIEHSLQGLAAYFRAKEGKAAATAGDTVATAANTAATATNATATEVNAVATTELAAAEGGVAIAATEATAATEALTVAEGEAAVATEAVATTLTGGLYAAIVAIVAVVGTAVKVFYDLFTQEKRIEEAQKAVAEAGKDVSEGLKKQIADYENVNSIKRRGLEDELSQAEKSGASQEKLFAIKKKIADFDSFNAKVIQASSEVTNTSFNETLDKYDKARSRVEFFNKEILKSQKIQEDNAKLGTFTSGAPFEDVDKLKKQQDVAKKELEQLTSQKEYEQTILENNANATRAVNAIGLEEQKFNADERRKIELEYTKFEQDLIKAKNDKILADERSTLKQRLQAIQSNAAAQKAILQAEQNDILNNPGSSEADKLIAVKHANTEIEKVNIAANKQKYDTQLTFDNKAAQAAKEARDIELNAIKSHNEDIVNQQQRELTARLAAQAKITESEKGIVENEYNDQKRLLGQRAASKEEYVKLDANREAKLLKISSDNEKEITKILIDEISKRKASQEDYLSFLTSDLNNQTSQQYTADVVALNDSFQKKKISVTDYERQRKNIEDKYTLQRLQDSEKEIRARAAILDTQKTAQQSVTSDIIDLSTKMSQATTDAEREGIQKQIAAKQKQLEAYKGVNQAILDNTTALNVNIAAQSEKAAEKAKELAERTEAARKKAAESSYDLLVTIGDAGYERELNHIQDLIDANDLRYSRQISNIENSSLSTQEKEAETILLEAEHDAKTRVLEKRKRDEQLSQAKFDRDAQALKIFGEAAAAHFKLISELGIAGLGLAITNDVIAATQIAALYAKPLPKFFRGVDSSPAGPAITDELGPELYINKAGEMTLGSNEGANIKFLEEGTRIIPHDKVNEYLQEVILRQQGKAFSTNPDINLTDIKTANAIDKQTTILKKAILSTISDRAPITKRELGAFADQIAKKQWMQDAMDRYCKW